MVFNFGAICPQNEGTAVFAAENALIFKALRQITRATLHFAVVLQWNSSPAIDMINKNWYSHSPDVLQAYWWMEYGEIPHLKFPLLFWKSLQRLLMSLKCLESRKRRKFVHCLPNDGFPRIHRKTLQKSGRTVRLFYLKWLENTLSFQHSDLKLGILAYFLVKNQIMHSEGTCHFNF